SSMGINIDAALKRRGLSDAEILKAKGEVYEIPTRAITEDVPFSVLEYIPEESANHYKVVPLGVKDGVLEVGLVDPDSIETRDALNFIAAKVGMPYKLYLISEEDLSKVLALYSGM